MALYLSSSPLYKMAAILADDIFKCIFVNENDRIPIRISLKFVPRCPFDNKAALVQVMDWHRTGAKPLPEPMMTQSKLVQVMAWCSQATSHYLSQCWPRLMSFYGVTRPQCVKALHAIYFNRNKNMYLQFLWFLHTDMTQVVKPFFM